jgi:hypothetical protein
LFNDEFYVIGQEWVFEFDITAWGWIHLILGFIIVASGIGIFSGNVAARTVGVIVAGSPPSPTSRGSPTTRYGRSS